MHGSEPRGKPRKGNSANNYKRSMVTLTDRQAVKMIADIDRLMRSARTIKITTH